MNNIYITLKRIEVSQFSPAKGSAQVSLWFNHTTPHMLQWWIAPGDKQEYASRIMKDIKSFVKSCNPKGFHDTDDVLAGHSLVLFSKEEETEEKLGLFLGKLIEKLKAFRNTKTSEGYLNKVASFEKVGMDF